jgi:hypothetical protein
MITARKWMIEVVGRGRIVEWDVFCTTQYRTSSNESKPVSPCRVWWLERGIATSVKMDEAFE